jgi:DNA-binding cell septation regulator SpoVG
MKISNVHRYTVNGEVFYSVTLDDKILLTAIRVKDGEIYLPCKKGEQIFQPLTESLALEMEKAIFKKHKEV